MLQDKALINNLNRCSTSMHDLIRDMGHEVVRRKSRKDLGQRMHLFDANDKCKVFEKNMIIVSIIYKFHNVFFFPL